MVVLGGLFGWRCWLRGAMVERVVGVGREEDPVVNTAAAVAETL